ncbi:hypothetical protein DFH11DRAFT_887691 [Phellopilus nigrolimitatus]|nr:hypothetical protein DFH11DRAFT_887691 [Phellopilus nigrolimitatus]
MAFFNRKAVRQDTTDTLVNSPTSPTGLLGGSITKRPVKKHTRSFGNIMEKMGSMNEEDGPHSASSPEAQTKDIQRSRQRGDTGMTLVTSPDGYGEKYDMAGGGYDAALVKSPTSPATTMSTPLSSMSSSTSVSQSQGSLTSSPPTSPEAPRLRKFAWPFSKKSRRASGSTLGATFEATFDLKRSKAMLVARTTANIAEATNLPYLKGVAGIVSLILEYADGVSANKENCFRIISNVMRLLDVLNKKFEELDGKHSKKLESQAKQLKHSLELIHLSMKALSDRKRGYFSKFTQQEEDKVIIQKCEKELDAAFKIFSLQTLLEVRTSLLTFEVQLDQLLVKMMEQLKRQNIEILEAIRSSRGGCTRPKLPGMNDEQEEHHSLGLSAAQRASTSTTQSALDKAVLSSPILPSSPKIFHGRQEELGNLVDIVTKNAPARIAILGTGGMGKSTLALKLLHHEDIKKQYDQRRFFIPCDSATSAESLISEMATHFGLSGNQRHTDTHRGREAEVLSLLSSATQGLPTIVVLDNFETPWELYSGRGEVEAFLGRLADLENVALVITLRGSERPRGVDWSRPFLPPLRELSAQAARSLFMSISDAPCRDSYDEGARDELDELLDRCGRLPLAVELMARLAEPGLESVSVLMRRWDRAARGTSMLSRGDRRSDSLEVSVELSLNSPRLAEESDACALLSILALLPDGIERDELALAAAHVQDMDACIAVLLRTSLAYRVGRERLRVLAPIREYVAATRKAQHNHIRQLEKYHWDQLSREREGVYGYYKDEDLRRVLSMLGNIESLIQRAFLERPVSQEAICAAVDLAYFSLQMALGKPRFLEDALTYARQSQNRKLEADCLCAIGREARLFRLTKKDVASKDNFLRALDMYKELESKIGQGECYRQLGLMQYSARDFEESRRSFEKALEIHREARDLDGEASTLLLIARSCRVLQQTSETLKHANAALGILRIELHNPVLEARCLEFLGSVYLSVLCEYTVAKELLAESLRIYDTLLLQDSSHGMDAIVSSGELALICSRYEEAKDAFKRAVSNYGKLQRRDREAYALVNLGLACLGLGDVEEASRHVIAGLAIWQDIGNSWGIGISKRALGDVAMKDGAHARAEERYTEALAAFNGDSAHWKFEQAECLLKLGILFVRTDQRAKASENLSNALLLYREAACPRGDADCLRYIGELDLAGGDDDSRKRALSSLIPALDGFNAMGLHREMQECASLIADAYRALGNEKQSRKFRKQGLQQLQIG